MKDEWLTSSSFIVNFASSFFSFSFSIWSLTFHMQSRLIKNIIAAERMRNLRTNCQEKHFIVRWASASLLQTIRIYHLFHGNGKKTIDINAVVSLVRSGIYFHMYWPFSVFQHCYLDDV